MGTTTRKRFSTGELAPVIIPTCNRWQHFQNLVRSLQACPGAEKTHLYIAIDAPFSEAVVVENQRILQIAEKLTGFGQVTIWKRESNLGAIRNIAEAVEQVFQNHDRLIFLEDDNVVAKNFLLFMNQAMGAFASDSRCFSVSGYHFTPIQGGDPKGDMYRSPFFSAWGVGLFRSRYFPPVRLWGPRLSAYFLNPVHYWRANQIDRRLFPMYLEARKRGAIHGDVLYRLYCLENKLFSVFPTTTKVINRGFDGSGINCGVLDKPFHDHFESEEQEVFCFVPEPKTDSFFQQQNCRWFTHQWPGLSKHSLSLFWRYFVRVVGLRSSPPPQN